MERLKVETDRYGLGVNVQKITGFTEQELKELGSMEQGELEETVLDMLDRRNGNIGTCWKCGYGVYRTWMHVDAVYMEVGNSCD